MSQEVVEGSGGVGSLRENFIFKIGMVRTESVHRRDAPHGSVQLIEKLLTDARGYFRAVSPGERVLVRNDRAIGFAHGGGNCFPIERRKRTQINNFHRHSLAL